jgi:membrane peptidoglycan carboxypeptidase
MTGVHRGEDSSGRAGRAGRRERARERARSSGRVRWRRAALRAAVALVAAVAVVCVTAVAYVAILPSVADAPQRVSRILALHHGTAGGPQPPGKLGDAVVAVEDEHFYSNFVVNVLDGAGRAAIATLHTDQDPGGSTIDQQLAKQLYGHGTGLLATLRQIGLGVKLALVYPKPQILAMYLNAVYFGNGYWGDVTAARGYFGVSPDRLDWAQAALLAGLPQAPSAYDPVQHLALAKLRQRHVLDRLVVNHYLTAAQANAAYAEPLGLR